jgi:hypothetical protein
MMKGVLVTAPSTRTAAILSVSFPHFWSSPSQVSRRPREASHTGFNWEGQLSSLPKTLRLPYLRHTPNLSTFKLTGCDIAIDDFVGILQHCPNLVTVNVSRINANTPILIKTFPRKIRTRFPHCLAKLTVSSAIDIHQLFLSIEWKRLSHLSLALAVGRIKVEDLKIPWNQLSELILDCWLRQDEVEAICPQVDKETQVKICHSKIMPRRYQTIGVAGRFGNFRMVQ